VVKLSANDDAQPQVQLMRRLKAANVVSRATSGTRALAMSFPT
jgi:hypothetical protein